MISPIVFLARQKPKTFSVNYAPEYKTFIPHHIAHDASHPLHIAQRRRLAERPKEGLWWHVTASTGLSKSSCVRNWARRRLRNAMRHALQQSGYDDMGNMVNVAAIQDKPDLLRVLQQRGTLNLKGSLKLNVQAPLIPTKYADLCTETEKLVGCFLQALKSDAHSCISPDDDRGFASQRKTSKNPQPQEFIARPPQAFRKGSFTNKGRITRNSPPGT